MEERFGIAPGPVPDDYYILIGKVTANWANLEGQIASSIWQIGQIPDEVGACITSQIFTLDAKLKALISILGVHGGFQKVISNLNLFHDDLRGLSNMRNRVTHDGWVGDSKTGVACRLQISADKKLTFGYQFVEMSYLEDLVDKISDAIYKFDAIIKPALDAYTPLSHKHSD